MPCSPARVVIRVVIGHLRGMGLGYQCEMALTCAINSAIEAEIPTGAGNIDLFELLPQSVPLFMREVRFPRVNFSSAVRHGYAKFSLQPVQQIIG